MTPTDFTPTEKSSRTNSSARLGRTLAVALALWFSVLVQVAPASEPEIIWVRLPAEQTSKYFPPGTELRVMPADEFETLVERAAAGSSRQKAREAPRLIRARHQARWSSGVLNGQTELVIESGPSGPADYVLDTWSPAVVRATGRAAADSLEGELPANLFAGPARTQPDALAATPALASNNVLGARDSGKTSIWVDCHPLQAVRLDWMLRPQKTVRGKSFNLALPAEETTILSLEVPKDWIPSIRTGRRCGPLKARSADQNLWEVEAESGRIELQIYDPDGGGESSAGPNLWASGATQVDLRRRLIDPRDWSTGPPTGCSRSIRAIPGRSRSSSSPGLELINVVGPGVRGYRILPSAGADRVVVTFGGELKPVDRGSVPGTCPRSDRGPVADPGDPALERDLDGWNHDGHPRPVSRRHGMHRKGRPARLRCGRRIIRPEPTRVSGRVSALGGGAGLSQAQERVIMLHQGPGFRFGITVPAGMPARPGRPSKRSRARSRSS